MRRALFLLALAALSAAHAQDKKKDGPFRWDPRQTPRVSAGARTFYDYETTSVSHWSMGAKGELTDVTSHSESTESYRWVRHVTGVESGEISEAAVKFERWKKSHWGQDDTSLEGKSVSLARAAGKLEPRIEDDEGVTSEARKWLEGELFRRSGRLAETEFMEDLLLPREPAVVTTGCEWTRDPKVVSLGLLRTTDLDMQRSSVVGKLEDVHLERGVHYGKAEVKAVLQVRKLDLQEMRFEDGAVVLVTWRCEGSLEALRREDGTRSLTFTIVGRSKLGKTLEAETRTERTETLKCGPAKK